MLLTSLEVLRCPGINAQNQPCLGTLTVIDAKKKTAKEVSFGTLECVSCKARYPILAGVAVIVNEVERYLNFHVKGISSLVADEDIPEEYREGFLEAKAGIDTWHTEEDLESQRVNALYFMNHFLSAKGGWWKPKKGPFSPDIDRLVRTHWDNGPFAKIAKWIAPLKKQAVIELGCGVGGLAHYIARTADSYLGVDMSFASIALARHVYLGAPYAPGINFPEDLYNGPLTGAPKLPKFKLKFRHIDFVVGDLESTPAAHNHFDVAVALNAIDMIEDPSLLPQIQHALLKEKGIAIQSSPYIWQKFVAEQMRETLPAKIKSSSEAVEYLYAQAGLKLFKKIDHLPWMFLKHFRQIELYSVHLFAARK